MNNFRYVFAVPVKKVLKRATLTWKKCADTVTIRQEKSVSTFQTFLGVCVSMFCSKNTSFWHVSLFLGERWTNVPILCPNSCQKKKEFCVSNNKKDTDSASFLFFDLSLVAIMRKAWGINAHKSACNYARKAKES